MTLVAGIVIGAAIGIYGFYRLIIWLDNTADYSDLYGPR